MNPLTDQEVAAELEGYRPDLWNGRWDWMRGHPNPRQPWRLPADLFDELLSGAAYGFYTICASYPTAEAAYADLAQAIRAAHEVQQ